MTRILVVLILFCAGLVQPVQADDAERLARAMTEIRAGDWGAALAAAGPPESVARDVIEWHWLRAGRGTADEVAAFLARRPDWPGLDWLRRKSEPAFVNAPSAQVLAFYAPMPPQTAEGALSHAAALIAAGRRGDAEAGLVLAWRTMPMGGGLHDTFLALHRDLLAPHHAARLDRMLWDGHMDSARRMLPLVDAGTRALAEARIALQDMAPGVDTRIAAVPVDLAGSAGLAYDRFIWRLQKGRGEDAILLMLEHSKDVATLGEPAKWADRRLRLARQEMRTGDAARAYRIAARHFLVEGNDFAELEWLSGYIALRRLNDPATALRHFQRFDGAVASPISKGRAGYWLGRAHEALGDGAAAQAAYAQGARYQSAFYGLLAAERGGLPFDAKLANPPELPPWRQAQFMRSSVLQAGLMLLAADERDLGERFLTHLSESLDETAAGQLGDMALSMDRPHLALMIAKRAAQGAMVLPAAYYPVHPVAHQRLPMAAEMTLAIARRESEFDPAVISGAGARGLMQVMPRTAEAVAANMGVLGGHSTDRLTSEWRYNATLGAAYLAGLAGGFDGNVVMMAAAYNAGPSRPLQWMLDYGDPRTGTVDIVDWIETIPFDETRNYVMRVTESLPVYRARLGKDPLPIPFSKELTGSTLRAFAP